MSSGPDGKELKDCCKCDPKSIVGCSWLYFEDVELSSDSLSRFILAGLKDMLVGPELDNSLPGALFSLEHATCSISRPGSVLIRTGECTMLSEWIFSFWIQSLGISKFRWPVSGVALRIGMSCPA